MRFLDLVTLLFGTANQSASCRASTSTPIPASCREGAVWGAKNRRAAFSAAAASDRNENMFSERRKEGGRKFVAQAEISVFCRQTALPGTAAVTFGI